MTLSLETDARASYAQAETKPSPSLSNSTPNSPALRGFLAAVLPSQGHYCVFLAERKTHHWAASLEELASLVEKYADRTDSYFGTASFANTGSRKA